VALFGALAGPIFEELVFRGFLQPLLARSMAAWIAILLTAVPFALLHGPGFGWAWQSVIIVGIAGVVMGYVRNRTGSTAASALVHIGYNSTLFVGFILQRFLQPLGSVAPR
jgi:membrane protease YdiL (CAAX protease family)